MKSRLSRLCAIGFAGKIALHLALIAAEIGERQERTADQPAPEVVAIVPIEVEIHGVQTAGGARQMHRVETEMLCGSACSAIDETGDERDEDHAHLLHVGPGDALMPPLVV